MDVGGAARSPIQRYRNVARATRFGIRFVRSRHTETRRNRGGVFLMVDLLLEKGSIHVRAAAWRVMFTTLPCGATSHPVADNDNRGLY